MIIIKARILHRSVFLAGETVTCQLIVSSTDTKTPRELGGGASKPEDSSETLAWASAQIHCQCLINERKVVLPSKYSNPSQEQLMNSVNTSFLPIRGEKGYCLYSTKPKILFCDLQLQPGETKSFFYSDTLPVDANPFYKGSAVRFLYKVSIGVGRPGKPAAMLRLPFRVLSTEGVSETRCEVCEPSGSNPFLFDDAKQCLVLDHLVESLAAMTMKRSTSTYNVISTRGSVGKFYLHRMCYRIGEDISGTFDFTDGDMPCIKYLVVLQSVEQVADDCIRPGNHSKASHASYSQHEECCYNMRRLTFSLPIPITVTPTFSSKIVSLRWRLHFEFMTSLRSFAEEVDNGNPPTTFQVETMAWDLPIDIIATNPLQVSMMVQSNPVVKAIVDK